MLNYIWICEEYVIKWVNKFIFWLNIIGSVEVYVLYMLFWFFIVFINRLSIVILVNIVGLLCKNYFELNI